MEGVEHVSEFKYLGCVLAEFGYRRGRGRVADAIKSLVNVMNLELECAIVLHETLLVPVLIYGSETILWKE